MTNVEGKKISMQDIKLVENRIERCLQHYMNKEEVVNTLIRDNVDPRFTDIVWRRLEEQYPEFFNAYYLKLLVKEQITEFNRLLSEQVELMCRAGSIGMASIPTSNGSHVSPSMAVVIVMLATFLMTLIMLSVWHYHWIIVLIFTGFSLVVECTYFATVLFKVNQGGWVSLVISAAFLVIMYTWHYGTIKRYEFEMHSKVATARILGLGPGLGLVGVPRIGLVYTELASGVSHIFSHFITNLPAIHADAVVVFVCVKYLHVYTVPVEKRFHVTRICPKNFHMLRCVVRYGYKDLHKKAGEFEKKLFDNLFTFVRL